ncbi:hypothetical protein V8E53_000590, partial [Lactarius tabidus]
MAGEIPTPPRLSIPVSPQLQGQSKAAIKHHYLNVPNDLSQILFVCTANTLDTISTPLLDRCEIIQLSGYTHDEKLHITQRFLLPKQLAQNCLLEAHVYLTELARAAPNGHTLHARGRSTFTMRAIGGIVRYKAVNLIKRSKDTGASYNPVFVADELEKILGLLRSDGEREPQQGVVWDLVVTRGHLKLTGSLGEVRPKLALIKESAELALSWVKTHSYDLGITNKRALGPLRIPDAKINVHLHLPAGAQKKNGPSTGVAM